MCFGHHYSMVPDCARMGRIKTSWVTFVKTQPELKPQGVDSKNLTPYKSLMGQYLKNVVQIKTTGVWLALKLSSQ